MPLVDSLVLVKTECVMGSLTAQMAQMNLVVVLVASIDMMFKRNMLEE